MKMKRFLSLLLIAALVLMLLPVTTPAADGTINDGGTYDLGDYGSDSTITISTPEPVTLTGSVYSSVYYTNVQIQCSVPDVSLTLDNVKIDNSNNYNTCALSFIGTGNTLTLKGENNLASGENQPGVKVENDTELTISGSGKLTASGGSIHGAGIGASETKTAGKITIISGTIIANGGSSGAGIGGSWLSSGGETIISGGTVIATSAQYGAGIGGGNDGDGGTIKITGGTVTASSGYYGAGIGGGNQGVGGNIEISGGTVTATGGPEGAGIGGGNQGVGGNITISGGTVTASGGVEGAGIGGGRDGNGGTVYISGGSVNALAGGGSAQAIGHGHESFGELLSGTLNNNSTEEQPVFLTTVTLENVNTIRKVTSLKATLNGNPYTYSMTGVFTDNEGKLYLYLPADTLTTEAATGTVKYIARTGEIVTTNDGLATGTLYRVAKSSSGGGGGGFSKPVYRADVSGGGNLPITVNQAGDNASVNISEQLGSSITTGGNVTITMPTIPGVSSYTLGIPVAYLSTPGGGTLTFRTGAGSITLPADMMAGVPGAEGKKAAITIGVGDKSSLPEDVKDAIGDRPLIDISLTLDGQPAKWNNPNAPVTVSIPYTPTAAELADPESIVVWYIDAAAMQSAFPTGTTTRFRVRSLSPSPISAALQ